MIGHVGLVVVPMISSSQVRSDPHGWERAMEQDICELGVYPYHLGQLDFLPRKSLAARDVYNIVPKDKQVFGRVIAT